MSFFNILTVEIKKNWGSIIKLTSILALFMIMIISVFDPELFSGFEDIVEQYPQAIIDMVGGNLAMGKLSGFITIEFLSLIWMWVGIYIILKASQDIPTAIDNKSIDLILSKPIKRWQFALAKHFRYIIQMLITFLVMILSIAFFSLILPNLKEVSINWEEYILTFTWAFVFCISLETTAFLFSTFMPRKKASGISFAIFALFFVIGTFYEYFDDSFHDMRFFSIFHYYNPAVIMVDHVFTNVGRDFGVLIGYSVSLTLISLIIFEKRDIPV